MKPSEVDAKIETYIRRYPILNLRLRLIDHDRSHNAPPAGHATCGKPACLAAEQLVEAHRLKYNQAGRKQTPLFYNGSSECDQISPTKQYLVLIVNGWLDSGGWFMGTFTEVSFGWSFDGWHAPIQLSGIWKVYEVEGLPTDDLSDPNAPPPKLECTCGCDDAGDHRENRYAPECLNCEPDCPGREG